MAVDLNFREGDEHIWLLLLYVDVSCLLQESGVAVV